MSKYVSIGLKTASRVTGVNQADFVAHRASGVVTIGPDKPRRGKASRSTMTDLITMRLFREFLDAGWKAREANTLATRFEDALDQFPSEDRLTLLKLENGMTRILPSSGLDLSTGMNSGSYVVSAFEFNVRNIREIIEKNLAAYPALAGGLDDADD